MTGGAPVCGAAMLGSHLLRSSRHILQGGGSRERAFAGGKMPSQRRNFGYSYLGRRRMNDKGFGEATLQELSMHSSFTPAGYRANPPDPLSQLPPISPRE